MVRLHDGRSVAIRPILPTDLHALGAFFESLAPATRRLRFHVSLNRLPESLLRAFTTIDHRAHVAFVAEVRGPVPGRPGRLVAEARYVRCPDSDSAELALVVAEEWRRVGLGTSLARALMRRARLSGLRRLFGDALWDNEEILGFMRSLGAKPMAAADNAETVRLCLRL